MGLGMSLIMTLAITYINTGIDGDFVNRWFKAFMVGFLTNGLNPKATLFFLSVFAVAVSPDTPNAIKFGYGLYLAFATGVWFCVLSVLLSSKKVSQFIGKKGYWFDRVMGIVLIILAIKLVMPV